MEKTKQIYRLTIDNNNCFIGIADDWECEKRGDTWYWVDKDKFINSIPEKYRIYWNDGKCRKGVLISSGTLEINIPENKAKERLNYYKFMLTIFGNWTVFTE